VSVAARYLRQVLLPEIGAEGQRRIAASAARVKGDASSLAHEVASLYARGAGFAALEAGPIDVAALAPETIVRDPAAREVLAGARAALGEMRRAIAEEKRG
jgi:molybdopterin/thiamine biosynthesis adenylyltransferase